MCVRACVCVCVCCVCVCVCVRVRAWWVVAGVAILGPRCCSHIPTQEGPIRSDQIRSGARRARLHEAVDVQLADVVGAPHGAGVVGRGLKVAHPVCVGGGGGGSEFKWVGPGGPVRVFRGMPEGTAWAAASFGCRLSAHPRSKRPTSTPTPPNPRPQPPQPRQPDTRKTLAPNSQLQNPKPPKPPARL